MGGKVTSGSASSPPARLSPPRAPISPPLSQPVRLDQGRSINWRERVEELLRTSPYVDYVYPIGLVAVVALAAYILAYG